MYFFADFTLFTTTDDIKGRIMLSINDRQVELRAMKTVLVCVCLVACVASAQGEARESRTVQTAQGPVRGYKNDEVFEFHGIPYATAPTGPNRFGVSHYIFLPCTYIAVTVSGAIVYRTHYS